jgi:hypothetical protein
MPFTRDYNAAHSVARTDRCAPRRSETFLTPSPFALASIWALSRNQRIIRATMAKYLFLAVICRTLSCTTECLVKYVGPYSGESRFQHLAPESFVYRCTECKQTHRYNREDIYPVLLDGDSPVGFESAF